MSAILRLLALLIAQILIGLSYVFFWIKQYIVSLFAPLHKHPPAKR